MSIDNFEKMTGSLTGPACANAAITPDDATDLPAVPRAIYVGGGGTVVIVGKDETSDDGIAFICPSGALLPIRARRIKATGTTATNLVAVGIK